jgi:hypothetical protein
MTTIEPTNAGRHAISSKPAADLTKRFLESFRPKAAETARSSAASEGISELEQAVGYLKGYPWPLLPVALGTLVKGYLEGNEKDQKNARVLLEMMGRGADFFTSLIWFVRGASTQSAIPTGRHVISSSRIPSFLRPRRAKSGWKICGSNTEWMTSTPPIGA